MNVIAAMRYLLFALQNLLELKAAVSALVPRSGQELTRKGEWRDYVRFGMTKMPLKNNFKVTTSNHRAEPVQIWKARKFIGEHSSEELSLRKVAKAANISTNYLSEKFKEVTGLNFVEHVARIRFTHACDLSRNSNDRVSDIAFAVGFQSLSQFNRVFKRLTSKSPTDYREEHLHCKKQR